MSQVLVRGVDEAVVAAIRGRAQLRGVSMEQELRRILERAAAWAADAEPAVYPPVRAVKTTGKPASHVLIGDRR